MTQESISLTSSSKSERQELMGMQVRLLCGSGLRFHVVLSSSESSGFNLIQVYFYFMFETHKTVKGCANTLKKKKRINLNVRQKQTAAFKRRLHSFRVQKAIESIIVSLENHELAMTQTIIMFRVTSHTSVGLLPHL